MITRRAQCSCGHLAAICTGEPLRLAICHCLACKRRTGSAFGFSAWFDEAQVSTSGRANEFVRVGDEGSRIRLSFCPDCGNTVFYRNDQMPGRLAITAGSFADMKFPAPQVSVYHESRKYPWIEITAEPLETNG